MTGIAVSFQALRPLVRRGPRFLLLAAAAFALLAAQPAALPPVPPLPSSGWPAMSVAEPFARALVARVPAAELARAFAAQPELEPAVLRNLGTAMMTSDAALRNALAGYLAGVARASASLDLPRLIAIVVVDPQRYGADAAFHARINSHLPRSVGVLPKTTAARVLRELTTSADLDFGTAEAAAAAALLIPHTSAERRIAFDRSLRLPDDSGNAIDASIFSLNTAAFTPDEALRFLDAVHAASPARRIIVLGDAAMLEALSPHTQRLHLELVDNLDRLFTPWPRDPFLVGRTKSGNVVFINRPNLQRHREEDQNMARVLAASLPNARWTVAPTPFHNGHILRTPSAVWISIHSVEPRALALLGLDHVPVETFGTHEGTERYLQAVRRAARELEELFHSPVRFVHPLTNLARLGGGAGVDLDSIVTLLPRAGGKTDALVGDVNLGAAAARNATAAEWAALRKAYGFSEDAPAVAAMQSAALQQYLDDVAGELRRDGMTVRRVPLLQMPRRDFLLTANNAVLETRGGVRRAEGFATLLPSIDRAAREAFAASGTRLDLFPPLVISVVKGGGYRCASSHLRK
jgi:hypothetical protein